MPKHAKFTHFQFEMKLVIKRIKMAPRDIKLVDQFFQKAGKIYNSNRGVLQCDENHIRRIEYEKLGMKILVTA